MTRTPKKHNACCLAAVERLAGKYAEEIDNCAAGPWVEGPPNPKDFKMDDEILAYNQYGSFILECRSYDDDLFYWLSDDGGAIVNNDIELYALINPPKEPE